MLGSRLFWKLFLGFTLVNLLAAGALVYATWFWQKDEATKLARRELTTACTLLAQPAADYLAEPTEAQAENLRRLADEAQISLAIDASDGEGFRHPADRQAGPQIRNSIALTSGEVVIGELTVGRSMSTLTDTLGALAARYTNYAWLVALAMVVVGYLLVAHLVGPVRALNRVATAMASGNYRLRAFVPNRDELGVLARSFNQMSEELGHRITELQESDRRQATVLGGMIEGVVAIDDRGRVLFSNPAAGKLFGFFPPEVVGRQLIEVVRNHSLYQASTAAIDSRTPQRLEIEWEEQVLSVQVTPLVGQPASGAVIVLHDTTELRRLENLRRDFVANVSHELKTPLSTIKANAETLLRGAMDDTENRGRFLARIDEQSDRLADLIQDMLNLARIESAQQPFEIRPVPIADAVESCLNDYGQRAAAKQIDLAAVSANGSAETLVKADREGLRVILSNLVDNAIKYTPEGGEVRVSWRLADEPDGMVRIEVADNGSGIPDEKLARVFERFYRVDEARSRHLGGTGLGLSIVKHLAQSFGGAVSVENRSKTGARFIVSLPAA